IFQAEDGIRDDLVTGVQTCALPILEDSNDNDKELGMRCGITRRDFLNGVALTAGAAILPPHLLAALQHDLDPEKSPGYYPPALKIGRASCRERAWMSGVDRSCENST